MQFSIVFVSCVGVDVSGSLVHRNDSGVLCVSQHVRVRLKFILVSVSEVSQDALSVSVSTLSDINVMYPLVDKKE